MEKQERLRIFIIVSSVLFAILLMANLVKAKGTVDIKETKRKVNEKNNSIVSSFDYNAKTVVAALKNEIIIYDGKNLVKKNDKFKNIFETRLAINDFVMKVEQEDIYILDKIDKILYKINKDGEIVSQAKFMESGQNIYPLKNGDVLLSYNTNVAADGIIVYDSDMKQKTNINYPNSLISTVNFEESTNTIYVSVQVNNLADITNTIYAYNSNYEVQSINSYKNLLTIEMINTNNSKLILDPTRLYILDGKYKNVATIDAQNSFAGMVLVNEKIYLLDGNKNVRIYDKTGKLLEEKAFKDTINKMILDMPQIIYIGTTSVHTQNRTMEFAKDIEKSVLLSNNKLVLFFKGNVEIIPIQ